LKKYTKIKPRAENISIVVKNRSQVLEKVFLVCCWK